MAVLIARIVLAVWFAALIATLLRVLARAPAVHLYPAQVRSLALWSIGGALLEIALLCVAGTWS
ncbi:hypothetical protein I5E68_09775 [Novosphingobium sp. YJ-S2-02]|uniref:Uncharacterized protein n=1 Tax=Novosphingobium aureum TaxID=2792964 RepID=A0A931HD27_9SPHN|nr:hypothetical protein [Novosphingobium aureum]MBH0113233.1 hypothetical protein [Novosphingobium aureum]